MEYRELWKVNGQAVRDARIRRGLSQLQLALAADVSPRSIIKAERGGLLFPRTLYSITAALGAELEGLRVGSSGGTAHRRDPRA